MNNEIDYTVSVRLMTYNHGKYIRQAMDSIMMQNTDFLVEVVVGDDFSQDDTLEIIREYKSTDRIHIHILNRRIGDEYWQKRQKSGRLYNFTDILENCHGKYIALLDGDDYWINEHKLSEQVKFLNVNPRYILFGGNAFVNSVGGNKLHQESNDSVLTLKDILLTNPFPTASVMFRNINLRDEFWLFYKTNFGDHLLYFLLASKADAFFKKSNAPNCVYRMHSEGVYAKIPRILRSEQKLNHFELLRKVVNDENRFVLNQQLSEICSDCVVRILNGKEGVKGVKILFLIFL